MLHPSHAIIIDLRQSKGSSNCYWGVLPLLQDWSINPTEVLQLLCGALLTLHAGLPSSSPAPASAFDSPSRCTHRLKPAAVHRVPPVQHTPTTAALPSATQLSHLSTLALAIASAAAAKPFINSSTVATFNAAAVTLATHLSLSCLKSSDPAAEARLVAAGKASTFALHSLLASGHAQPETPGLLSQLLRVLPALLSRKTPEEIRSSVLLLVDEMCRSKRSASRVVNDTAVAQALVSLYRFGGDMDESVEGQESLLKRLLDRLRCYDTYHALDKAYPDTEEDGEDPLLDEEQLQKQVEAMTSRATEKQETIEAEPEEGQGPLPAGDGL